MPDTKPIKTPPTAAALPLPPYDLALRTGPVDDPSNFWGRWLEVGEGQARFIESYLPPGWAEQERRVLDFGCGSGRTLRNLGPMAAHWEVWGCDIHHESIEWLSANLSPPFHFFEVTDEPHLPQADGFFDLVWGLSVFTHITDTWSAWLLELHRVLKPDGLAILSFLGKGMIGPLTGEEWRPDRIGMNCLRELQSWDIGGPIVLHSEWWLRAHWGRLFTVVRLDDYEGGHGMILLQKRDVQLTPAELEAPEPGEPRELEALRHNVRQLQRDEVQLWSRLDQCRDQCELLREEKAAMQSTWSWRLTRPLRRLRNLVNQRPSGRGG